MTSMQSYATSAPKASSSATSPPPAAGPTGAGRDRRSSAQSVSAQCDFRPAQYYLHVISL